MRLSGSALIVALGVLASVLNGCAAGRVRLADGSQDARVRKDRIPAKQSSYRVRGTDETGVLSASEKRRLRSNTHAWRWPADEVTVTSVFGERGKGHHDGIDLRAAVGTPVRAASDGKIIYSGSKIGGYGKMIVIRHAGKLSSVYAHNSKLLVKAGQKVRRGQLIAYSGNTGRSSGPHIHFEIREGVTAINPMLLLPSPKVVNEANRRMLGRSGNSKEESVRGRQERKPARSGAGHGKSERRSYTQSSSKRVAVSGREASQR
jgi:murein DD-endopeptidase MepM/ murein hydrolase activator NlpD